MSMELRKKARELAEKHAKSKGLFADMDLTYSWVVDAIEEALKVNMKIASKTFFRIKNAKTGLYKKGGNGAYGYNWSAGGKTWTRSGDVKNSLWCSMNYRQIRNIQDIREGKSPHYPEVTDLRFPDDWVVECHDKDGGWTKSANEFMGIV